jgi:hypothetical protein
MTVVDVGTSERTKLNLQFNKKPMLIKMTIFFNRDDNINIRRPSIRSARDTIPERHGVSRNDIDKIDSQIRMRKW